MACGVPIITTPTGLAKDMGEDGRNMISVPFENREKLIGMIEKDIKLTREYFSL